MSLKHSGAGLKRDVSHRAAVTPTDVTGWQNPSEPSAARAPGSSRPARSPPAPQNRTKVPIYKPREPPRSAPAVRGGRGAARRGDNGAVRERPGRGDTDGRGRQEDTKAGHSRGQGQGRPSGALRGAAPHKAGPGPLRERFPFFRRKGQSLMAERSRLSGQRTPRSSGAA